MTPISKTLTGIAFLALVAACGKTASKPEAGITAENTTETTVDTLRLRQEDFNLQLICNGKLSALKRSEITFPAQGITTRIEVRNGSRVEEGDLLAAIDSRTARMQLEKSERDLEKARIDLADKLIGLGYEESGAGVPEEVMRRAKMTSGYYSAEYQLAEARRALVDCELRAPFSGRVADMECQLFQKAEKFGVLIDDSEFDVEFSVLEAELKAVKPGQTVRVTPFAYADKTFTGRITHINPTVNEKGLVKIEARIPGTDPALIDGMNVRVVIEKTVPGAFVVPKDAVAERDGYYVIFEVKNAQAVWTYVDIAYANLDSYAITGCQAKGTTLKEGEAVIISNIQNLADGTRVNIRN